MVRTLRFGLGSIFQIGGHLGHLFFFSRYFNRWMLYSVLNIVDLDFLKGFELKYELFLINVKLTLYGLKSLVNLGRELGLSNPRAWLVSSGRIYSPLVIRYGILLGFSYMHKWIPGCLTNMGYIFGYIFSLYYKWVNNLKLKSSNKALLRRIWGLKNNGYSKPFFILLLKILKLRTGIEEISYLNIKSVCILDSNCINRGIHMPIPGNDDSFSFISMFSYVFSYSTFLYNIYYFKTFKHFLPKWNLKSKMLSLFFIFLFFFPLN